MAGWFKNQRLTEHSSRVRKNVGFFAGSYQLRERGRLSRSAKRTIPVSGHSSLPHFHFLFLRYPSPSVVDLNPRGDYPPIRGNPYYDPAQFCFLSEFCLRKGWYSMYCVRQGSTGSPSVVLQSHPWVNSSSLTPLRFLLFNSPLAARTYHFGCPFGRLRALSEVEGRLRYSRPSVTN